jgi:hypothetical protein
MTFSVVWTQEAFAALSRIASESADPARILAAIRGLEEQLSNDPASKGESRVAGERIIFVPPLAARFQVHWRLNEVVIGGVWKFD